VFAIVLSGLLISLSSAGAQESADAPNAVGTRPGPGVFRIGNAISPVNYWMTAWMLNDVFKMAGFEAEIGNREPSRAWVPELAGAWRRDLRHRVPTDSRGWPTSLTLTDGRRADRLTTIVMGAAELPGQFPAGTYRMTYDGEGSVQVLTAPVVSEKPGEILIDYDGKSTLMLSLTETDPAGTGDYIRNISIRRPDATDGERFNQAYLDYLRPFSVIRPLHFFGDQLTYGPASSWEARKRETCSHWGGALGAPYEVAADLANQSASDLWLNVPIAAGDSYMRQLAALMLRELGQERRLYVELGNELWNYAPPYDRGRAYALQQARRQWPDVEGRVRSWSGGDEVGESQMLFSWQGKRTVEMCRIFREAWDEAAERVTCVAAGQIGGSAPYYHPSRFLLESPVYVHEAGGVPAGEVVDAFAVAPYISEEEGVIDFDSSSPAAFIADAIGYVRGEGIYGGDSDEPGLRFLIRSDRALAAEFGLPLVAYEGGQHFVGSRFTRDRVNTHPDMYELYRALFEVWQEEGGGLFVHYAGIIPRGQNEPGTEPGYYQSENFGIKELQTQPLSEAPKLRATLDVMAEIGQR
jgi:hypothetical protein